MDETCPATLEHAHGNAGAALAGIVIPSVTPFSVGWQRKQARPGAGHRRALARLAVERGLLSTELFDPPLFAGKYRDWGRDPRGVASELFSSSRTVATLLPSLAAIGSVALAAAFPGS